jgi:hypothetical protein
MADNKWLQIARADSKGKILDLTDPDPQPKLYDPEAEESRKPKLALHFVEYDPQTNQANKQHRHFIDLAALRVLSFDLGQGYPGIKGDRGYLPICQEFKGGPAKAAGVTELGPDGFVSRSLSVGFNDQLQIGPVFQFKFELREGLKGGKGQITPVRDGKIFLQAFINLSVPLARQFGMTIYQYLQAKDTAALVFEYGR